MKQKLLLLVFALAATFSAQAQENTHNGHEYVDLGLPSGTLWATCNVGANSPEEYGDYFAWGETKPKDVYYHWGTYKWMNEGQSSGTQINKYTIADQSSKGCWYSNGAFVGDSLTELLPEDDAAAANWGGDWRMPSEEQQDELRNNCTWEWTQLNGVNGCKVTGPNGNSIFLPATGYRDNTSLESAGSKGYCWSRSLSTYYSGFAYTLRFGSGDLGWCIDYRYYGRNVRPVVTKNDLSNIGVTNHNISKNADWYSLDGRRINGEPVQKGVYIYKGKKVIK